MTWHSITHRRDRTLPSALQKLEFAR
jgi:hypothetical protein